MPDINTKPPERIYTALAAIKHGATVAEVATAAEVSTRTIHRWAKRYGVSLPKRTGHRPGSGRPRTHTLTDEQAEAIAAKLATLGIEAGDWRALMVALARAIIDGTLVVMRP